MAELEPKSVFDSHPPIRERVATMALLSSGDIPIDDRPGWTLLSGIPSEATSQLVGVEGPPATWEELVRVSGPAQVRRYADALRHAGRVSKVGETLADAENPVALPLIHVDEPAISMTIGTNTSPLAGRGPTKNTKVTARLVKDRLDSELVGNVSLRILPTARPDAWEVQGRGELALAILVEQMRREGYELTVGKPQVVTKEIDGKVHEPVERMTIDVPEEHMGAVTQLMGVRKGRMDNMSNHGSGWVRMEFVVPSRGLIGFRTEFLTGTRGTGIAHSIHEGHEPWFGTLTTRNNGSLVADRSGAVTAFAMTNLQERGVLFTDPGTEVYEGMIVGENSRSDDMDVNITKEKKLTNMRSSSADSFEAIVPPRKLSLEQSLEFCRDDECVEVTPEAVRIRKVNLDQRERARAASRAKNG